MKRILMGFNLFTIVVLVLISESLAASKPEKAEFIDVPASQLAGGAVRPLPFTLSVPANYILVTHPHEMFTNYYIDRDEFKLWQKGLSAGIKDKRILFKPFFFFENSSTVGFDHQTGEFSTERNGKECGSTENSIFVKKRKVAGYTICEVIGKLTSPITPDEFVYVHIFNVDMQYAGWVWTGMHVFTLPKDQEYTVPEVWTRIRNGFLATKVIEDSPKLMVRIFQPDFDDDRNFPNDKFRRKQSKILRNTIEAIKTKKVNLSQVFAEKENEPADFWTFIQVQDLELATGRKVKFNKFIRFESVGFIKENSTSGTVIRYGERFFVDIYSLNEKITFYSIQHDGNNMQAPDLSENKDLVPNEVFRKILRAYAAQRAPEFMKFYKITP